MTLLDRFEQLQKTVRGIDAIFGAMSDDEADVLRKLLLDKKVSILGITNALKSEGIPCSRETLTRYRNENLQS